MMCIRAGVSIVDKASESKIPAISTYPELTMQNRGNSFADRLGILLDRVLVLRVRCRSLPSHLLRNQKGFHVSCEAFHHPPNQYTGDTAVSPRTSRTGDSFAHHCSSSTAHPSTKLYHPLTHSVGLRSHSRIHGMIDLLELIALLSETDD